MIKIFISVRNRIAITQKCITSIKRHSKLKHQIYIYDNASNHLVKDHFLYFYNLYNSGQISQITFTTEQSTFKAFSKASTCNFFGQQHEQDPNKDKFDYLVMMDNDIIVAPDWDEKLLMAWKYVTKHNMKNIKVIGQRPGGIKNLDSKVYEIGKNLNGKIGSLGGSGLWSVRPNFFRDVGFLDLKRLVGQDKKHDQLYWQLMARASGGKPYIMGLITKLGYHCGPIAGSVCNRLTRNKRGADKSKVIKFEENENRIASFDFDTFYKKISTDKKYNRW
jgi:hypothetical protein